MRTNFTGTWHADLSKSRFIGAAPRALTVNIKEVDSVLTEEVLITKEDGNVQTVLFECSVGDPSRMHRLNGKEIKGSARWQDATLVIESWIPAGDRTVHLCDHWSLSSDGVTLSMDHPEGDRAGQHTILYRAEE